MADDDLEAQLAADLEAVSLSDDDYEGEPPPLPAVVALAPIEQLIADAEESACEDAPVDGPLARLNAMLEAGDRARGRYMAEVSELQELVADLPTQAQAPAADAAAPAAEPAFMTSTEDAEEDSVEEPWWVAERKQAWHAEAERDAQREQASQAAAAEREATAQAAQAAAKREAAAVAQKLEEEQAALRVAQEEQLRERERQQLLARQRQQEHEETQRAAAEAEAAHEMARQVCATAPPAPHADC